jgi:hypothetical protein
VAQGHKTGGRQKGTKNRKTVLLEEKGREALAEVLGADAFDGDAHSLLIAIYKDESHPVELRLEAAKAAIRFEKPALAALDARGTIENVHYGISDQPLTEDEWAEQHIISH